MVGCTGIALGRLKVSKKATKFFQCEAYVFSVLWWYDAWTKCILRASSCAGGARTAPPWGGGPCRTLPVGPRCASVGRGHHIVCFRLPVGVLHVCGCYALAF